MNNPSEDKRGKEEDEFQVMAMHEKALGNSRV